MPNIGEISVVIPVYNNAPVLRELTVRLLATLGQLSQAYEIIYVNDGSLDNSLAILRELAVETPSIKVINLSRNFGQHPAICAGFEHSQGDITVLMDADLQDRPEDIVDLVNKLRNEGADIAYTTKQFSGKRVPNRFTSILFSYVFARIIKTKVPLNIRTFRAFNRRFLDSVLKFREVNVLYGPLMFFMGFKSCFLELPHHDRPHGRSSYTFRKRLQLALDSLVSYTDVPHKISMIFGVILLFGSMAYGLIITLEYLLYGASLPAGSTLILLVLCLAFGSLMMTLGVIGTYVFRVYQQVLNRPRYLVQERINFSRGIDSESPKGFKHE
jgi:glycosyltransferase involved in cell wall biosynthesis